LKEYIISNSSIEGEIFMIWVGIVGAKGYLGEALARLVAGHPEAQVSTVMDLQEFGDGVTHMCGSAEARPGYRNLVNAVKKSDIIFSGLTGGFAEDVYDKALSYGKRIIDVSDMHNTASYLEGTNSAYPGSVYGLSELYKDKMKDAAIVANPSSYCTGAILGLAPLTANKMIDVSSAIIESKSGITSLRRSDKLTETGMVTNSGVKTYKVECKDYAEEVNGQMLTLFGKRTSTVYTSHIIPGIKGITTTINVNPQVGAYGIDILDIFKEFYKTNPFIEVCNNGIMPEMKKGFNKYFCKIGASVDAESGKITVTTVLDDALRGAASQAIQSMNLMCGIDGKTGL
jgi:N-acetyl-gamma-glutamyl-phosphate reductase